MKDLAKKEQSNIVAIDTGARYQKLMEMALSNDVDINKMEKLMDLQERWEAKEANKAFSKALALFQSKCPTIKKSKSAHNYKYAPMEDIVSQVSGLLADCGLSYRFEQDQGNGIIGVTCVVTHLDGHQEKLRIEAEADTGPGRNKIQSIGSTITYLKRYAFQGSLGIATADEDIDGRLPPKTEGKKGNWRAGMDPKLLPSTLRGVFFNIFEAYEDEDLQTVCEKFSEFGYIEERNAVWRCFASDERSAITKFTNSDEYTINPDILKVDYLSGEEQDRFLEGCNG